MRFLSSALLISSLLVLTAALSAQQPADAYNRDWLSEVEAKLNQRNVQEFPNIQPAAHGLESTWFVLIDSSNVADKFKSSINFNPLLNIGGGYQMVGEQDVMAEIAGGLSIDFQRHNKWSAELGYTMWNRYSSGYLKELGDSLRVVPGVGFQKGNDQLQTANYTFGHVSYTAGKYFHFEAGKGKHFWGDGFRSLIMSDNSSSYPYFRITTKIWKIKYTNLWAQMRDISFGQDIKDARKKYVAMHALSWNATKSLNFTFFEMVVWQDRDSLNRRTLDMNYLNPVIFFRPVEYAQGSADNEILGFSFRVKASAKIQVYGQLLLDEFLLTEIRAQRGWWANKFGTQVGLKFFNIFTPGLGYQTEFNSARPFTYTHGSPIQAWSNTNQALAHPLGANFLEWLHLFRFDRGNWKFREKFIWAAYGRDRDGDPDVPGKENYGGEILRSYRNPYRQYGNEILQGLKSTTYFSQFEVCRKINTSFDLELFAEYSIRFEKNELETKHDQFVLFGIRTDLMLVPARDY